MVSRRGAPELGAGPVRTCVGCRARAAKRELLRVVAGRDTEEQASGETRETWFVVPDPAGTAPGRGAHLHPTPDCLALAERRRAFGRALRHDAQSRGTLSQVLVEQYLAQHDQNPIQPPVTNGSTSS